jgi:hypothetical protein
MNPPEYSPLDPTPVAGPVNERAQKWAGERADLLAEYNALLAESRGMQPVTDGLNRAQRRAQARGEAA